MGPATAEVAAGIWYLELGATHTGMGVAASISYLWYLHVGRAPSLTAFSLSNIPAWA